jgi:hypothetical protein
MIGSLSLRQFCPETKLRLEVNFIHNQVTRTHNDVRYEGLQLIRPLSLRQFCPETKLRLEVNFIHNQVIRTNCGIYNLLIASFVSIAELPLIFDAKLSPTWHCKQVEHIMMSDIKDCT